MTRPPNGLGPGNDFAPVLRPTLTPYEVITVTPATEVAAHAQCAAAVAAAASLPKHQRMLEVIYEPGIYTSLWGGFSYCHSSTLDPHDVIVRSDVTGGGVHHSYSSPLSVVEGITLHSKSAPDGGEGPKYPLHVTSSVAGSAQVWSNCIFLCENENGGNLVGLDGGEGLSLHFYDCHFDNQGRAAFGNLHGALGNTRGLEISFIHCTAVGATPKAVGYDAMSPAPDRLYIAGGNLTLGDVQGAGAGPGPANTWPVPVGGLSPAARFAMQPLETL